MSAPENMVPNPAADLLRRVIKVIPGITGEEYEELLTTLTTALRMEYVQGRIDGVAYCTDALREDREKREGIKNG